MRVTRERRPLRTEFEINFKVTVEKPGATQAEVEAHIAEMLRYANGAFMFKLRHRTGEKDPYRRAETCRLTVGIVAETGKP